MALNTLRLIWCKKGFKTWHFWFYPDSLPVGQTPLDSNPLLTRSCLPIPSKMLFVTRDDHKNLATLDIWPHGPSPHINWVILRNNIWVLGDQDFDKNPPYFIWFASQYTPARYWGLEINMLKFAYFQTFHICRKKNISVLGFFFEVSHLQLLIYGGKIQRRTLTWWKDFCGLIITIIIIIFLNTSPTTVSRRPKPTRPGPMRRSWRDLKP